MAKSATTAEEYIAALPAERQVVMKKLRTVIKKKMPKGFAEIVGHNMILYVVPHSRFPAGYHVDPKKPLMLMGIASQKASVAVHHLGMYGDPKTYTWFSAAVREALGKKPTIGKGCIRFSPKDEIPYDIIGELASKYTVEDWIERYTAFFRR